MQFQKKKIQQNLNYEFPSKSKLQAQLSNISANMNAIAELKQELANPVDFIEEKQEEQREAKFGKAADMDDDPFFYE